MTKETTNAVDIFNDFAVVDDAVWVDYHGDVSFKIKRADNPQFQKRLSYFYKRNQRMIEMGGDAGEKKSEEIMVQVQAETILVGWKGNLQFQGQPMEYSVENAKKLLAVPLFREWVGKQSRDTTLFKVVQDQDNEGN